jgi:plasmid stability protein
MATLTVRNLEDEVRDRLRVRAARSGRSMEDEVRVILRSAVMRGDPETIWREARQRFSGENGIDLLLPDRGDDREPPVF